MKLPKEYQEFRNPKVFYPDPKNIDLDRVLITLFVLLRCNGQKPVSRVRQQQQEFKKVDVHLDTLAQKPGVSGFTEHREVAQKWLQTDIFDLVNRGRPTEAIASLRPLHLDAHKIRVSRFCRDYFHADALYAMLSCDSAAVSALRDYLLLGRDPKLPRYDGKTELDLETLTVLKLVEGIPDLFGSGEPATPHPPICLGQARVLCDDIQSLLAYRHDVPRPVMIDYLKTILGMHLGLFTLRLSRQLPGWIDNKKADDRCKACPVQAQSVSPFSECPYPLSLTVDMGADYRSRMAQLAQKSASEHYERLAELVRAILAMNQLLRFTQREHVADKDNPFEAPSLLASPSKQFNEEFELSLREIARQDANQEQQVAPEVQAILDSGLPPFDTFIEIVTHLRQKHHVSYLVQMIDKLFQKNGPFGALCQGRSLGNPRRWGLGGRLLEVFGQLAVLRSEQRNGQRRFYTEHVLIEDFIQWIEYRYGFVIAPSTTATGPKPVTLDEHRAFRENVHALKSRLREIGFFEDLSDAFNAQTIRPRYRLAREGNY